MKLSEVRVLMAGLSGAIVLALTFGSTARAGTVVGSEHDLRAVGGGTPIGTGLVQVCVPCHTPHQATTANGQVPLWNHTISSTASYGVYASSTLNATPVNDIGGATVGTASVSNLCLSCHDGTVSVLSMYKQPVLGGTPSAAVLAGYTAGVMNNTNMAYIGTSLSDDHPINFTYNGALATADGGLVSPLSANCVAGTPCTTPLFPGTGGLVSTVQCASCHNVHDPTNVPFLRKDNTASALCLTCHVK